MSVKLEKLENEGRERKKGSCKIELVVVKEDDAMVCNGDDEQEEEEEEERSERHKGGLNGRTGRCSSDGRLVRLTSGLLNGWRTDCMDEVGLG
ncbi:hypothetical protein E2C01_077488 [Portunus trituberculatus]|uniref:Uncharacterized protein n=1 Tax=Portunus trituberculatus TaxID=210409 RepID=A0A5B7IRG3_PORTR|nr:hypothetical protein [Portunus trituberculatus]